MAVSRWCRARSVQLRTAGTALPSTTPGWMTNRWKKKSSSGGCSLVRRLASTVGTSANRRPVEKGEGEGRSVSIGHFGAIKIRWPTVDCQLRISRGLDTRGATHATGHLEPKDCNELTTVALLVALSPCLSRRCLIFSARPRTDTRSRRTEPRRGCGWSPLPCLSVALYQKEAGIIGSLVPLPSTQRHLTPPNTAKQSLAVDAGLAATSTIHMDCLAPLLRCAVGVPLSGPLVRR